MKHLKRITALLLAVFLLAALIPTASIEAAGKKVDTTEYTLSKAPGVYTESFKVKLKAKAGYNVYYAVNGKLSTKKVVKSGKSKSISINKFTTLKVYAVSKSKTLTKAKLQKYYDKGKFTAYSYAISDYPEFSEAFSGIEKATLERVINDRLELMSSGVKILIAVPTYSRQFIKSDSSVEYFAAYDMYGLTVEKGRYIVKNGGEEIVKMSLTRSGNDFKVKDCRYNVNGEKAESDLKDMCKDYKQFKLAEELAKAGSNDYANLKKTISALKTYNSKNKILDITAIKFTDGLTVCIE